MSLQLSHNSYCGMKNTVLFFRLKTENWYSQSHSVLSYLFIILLCGTRQVLWLELPKYKVPAECFFSFLLLGWVAKEMDW